MNRCKYFLPMSLFSLLVSYAAMVIGQEGSSSVRSEAFDQTVKPFLERHCERCHNEENLTSGIRVDRLSADVPESQLKLLEGIRKQVRGNLMPPEDEPQPDPLERDRFVRWVDESLRWARLRVPERNGGARRLTVAQYRNTIRHLLGIDEDLTDILPPDAVSKDGFVNNQETLVFSPLLAEAYLEIARKALDTCIVDHRTKPSIQNFRVDLGKSINTQPCPDQLVLGAESLLLDNRDFVVTQLRPKKPFDYESFVMRTSYRFIEGYQGNDTVRGWRDFDSIYHSVFACMRGARGYPKGEPYETIPSGLLLRPAIPSAEIFGVESTYGPQANFKISLRELPDYGRFRIKVRASKFGDGLLLDPGVTPKSPSPSMIEITAPDSSARTVKIPQSAVYQIDVYPDSPQADPVNMDPSRLDQGLIAKWDFEGDLAGEVHANKVIGQLEGGGELVDTPFGKGLSLDGQSDFFVVRRKPQFGIGRGDFTVAAWIRPTALRQAGIVALGRYGWMHGWYFDMPNDRGVLRVETCDPQNRPNGTVESPPGTLRSNVWQHVAAVVRRGENKTELFVNGYPVGRGTIGPADLDNPSIDLYLGRIPEAQMFQGALDQVRLYDRALEKAEIQALVEPGRRFATAPPFETLQRVALTLGDRQISSQWQQPAYAVVRLSTGELKVTAQNSGATKFGKVTLTPLEPGSELFEEFVAFERREPRVGVHLGLRRDCGSTLSRVGSPQTVRQETPELFIFEGAIRDFPSPDVERDNVNYLAGIREIGVRSEYTDGRDMPRLLIHSVEFEGPVFDSWPPESHRSIFGVEGSGGETDSDAERIICRFAERAFRRPVTPDETVAAVQVYRDSRGAGAGFSEAIKEALLVVLTSPQFLFLVEDSQGPHAETINPFELASKLSYFLWNGPPDSRLLTLAADNQLHDAIDSEVTRMVSDVKFDHFVTTFTSQWLALEKFAVLEPDSSRFPKLTKSVRAELASEPIRFVEYLIRNNLEIRNLVRSDHILANEATASYYGLGDLTESGFEFVPIIHRRPELGGLLSQPAIMAGLSDGREANPVKRGAWLARRIVAEPPDDPPPNVPAISPDQSLPLKERLRLHREQPGCAQCHSKIDPWGIALEQFDAGGLVMATAVDTQTTLPDGTEIKDFESLRDYLTDDRLDQLAFSFLKHLMIYAVGRTLGYYEQDALRKDCLKLKADGYRARDMIRYVVRSPIFIQK